MAKFRSIKNSLLGGQVSRTALGRTDLPTYPHSCEILQNMIPMLSGGGYRRPGTLNQASLSSATYSPPRLVDFIVSRNEAYCLAFTSIAGICNVKAFRATGNMSGQVTTELATGATYPFIQSTATTLAAGGTIDDDVQLFQHAQSADVLYTAHPNWAPGVVTRTAPDTFQSSSFLLQPGLNNGYWQSFPYLNQNTNANYTLAPSATTGAITVVSTGFVFDLLHVGSFFAIDDGTAKVGSFQVTGSTQNFSFNSVPTSGSYIISYNGQGTSLIAYNALAATIQTQLRALSTLSAFVTVTGTYTGGFVITLVGVATPQSLVTITNSTDASGTTVALDTTKVSATVASTLGTTSARATWWEAAWSDFRGWPRAVCIFQQRLCYAGTKYQPDTMWFSATANYTKFNCLNDAAPALTAVNSDGSSFTTTAGYIRFPVDDSEGDAQSTGPRGLQPFRVTLSQNTLDQIQWLSPDKELLIGTLSQEWITTGTGSFDVGSATVQIQSKYGSDYLPAVRIGYEVIFPLATRDEVRAYQYNYIDSSFFAEPVQLMFDEYPKAETSSVQPGRRKFRQIAWDVSRQTLWCLDTNGNFFGMTRDRKLNTTMWHTHQFGGFDTTKGSVVNSFVDPAWRLCDGSVVSFCILPNPLSGGNDIWLCVKRTIAGTVNWQLERMIGKGTVKATAYSSTAPGFSSTEPLMVDSAYVANDAGSSSTLTYTVGSYLNGYSLVGTYYSAVYGMMKVLSGAVSAGVATLTGNLPTGYGTASNIITLGLPFYPIIQPVRIDVGSVIGTAQAALKIIARAYVRFFKTLAASVGSPPNGEDSNPLEVINFFTGRENMGSAPELFTGDKPVEVPATYDRDGYLYLTQTEPMPFTVVSIVVEGEEYD